MLRKMRRTTERRADVVFMPALTPLEASVLPAQERKTYGVLRTIRRACDAGKDDLPQRTKIWVR